MARTPLPLPGPSWYVELAEAFLGRLRVRNHSPNTRNRYRSIYRRFGQHLEFCRVDGPENLIPAVLYAFQDRISEDRSAATRAQAASALRSLLRWAAREESGVRPGLWEHLETVSVPEQLPRALDTDQVQLILDHYAQACSEPTDDEVRYLELRRDRALFMFLLTAGCRITEALSLRRAQVETAGNRLVVIQKGGREHLLVPSAAARAWLHDYLIVRGKDNQPALWVRFGPRGVHRMRLRDANRVWAALCQQLRLPLFTSHVIRHTGATEMGEDGASDTEIARHLGHKTNQMVIRYRKVREGRRRELADQLDRFVPVPPVPPAPTQDPPARRSRRRSRAEIMGGKRKR